jgi:hypothetical protein
MAAVGKAKGAREPGTSRGKLRRSAIAFAIAPNMSVVISSMRSTLASSVACGLMLEIGAR